MDHSRANGIVNEIYKIITKEQLHWEDIFKIIIYVKFKFMMEKIHHKFEEMLKENYEMEKGALEIPFMKKYKRGEYFENEKR